MALIQIGNIHEWHNLGKNLAEMILRSNPFAILLKGELGAGKTTLVSSIVSFLPGNDLCEVASPSFNIYNIYPTTPQIIHCDLYRCQSSIPEEILDHIHGSSFFSIIEWADFLPENEYPEKYLDISIKIKDNARLLEINTNGIDYNLNELLKIVFTNFNLS